MKYLFGLAALASSLTCYAQELSFERTLNLNQETEFAQLPFSFRASDISDSGFDKERIFFRGSAVNAMTFDSAVTIDAPTDVHMTYQGKSNAQVATWLRRRVADPQGPVGLRTQDTQWFEVHDGSVIVVPQDEARIKRIEQLEKEIEQIPVDIEALKREMRPLNFRIKHSTGNRKRTLEQQLEKLLAALEELEKLLAAKEKELERIRCRELPAKTLPSAYSSSVTVQGLTRREAEATCQGWYKAMHEPAGESYEEYLTSLKRQLKGWCGGGMLNNACIVTEIRDFDNLDLSTSDCGLTAIDHPICKTLPSDPDAIPNDVICPAYFHVYSEFTPYEYGIGKDLTRIQFVYNSCSKKSVYEMKMEITYPEDQWSQIWDTPYGTEDFEKTFEEGDITLGEVLEFLSETTSMFPVQATFLVGE